MPSLHSCIICKRQCYMFNLVECKVCHYVTCIRCYIPNQYSNCDIN